MDKETKERLEKSLLTISKAMLPSMNIPGKVEESMHNYEAFIQIKLYVESCLTMGELTNGSRLAK